MKEGTQAKFGLIGFVVIFLVVTGMYSLFSEKQEPTGRVENIKVEETTVKSKRLQEQIAARKVRNQQVAFQRRQQEAKEREFDQKIAEMLSSGIVHSVNVEYNEVRIAPVIWLSFDLETKRRTVLVFSRYFDMKGSTGRVTILSNRNDVDKLGSYSVWSGVKIYR